MSRNRPGVGGAQAHLVRGLQFEFLKDLLRLRLGGCHGERERMRTSGKKGRKDRQGME